MERRSRCIILTIAGVVVVGAIVVVIAVPLSKRSDELTEEESLRLAEQWMSEAPLIDSHNDLPWFLKIHHDNRLQDIDLSINISDMYEITHTDIPRLRAGHVAAQFWSTTSSCDSQYKDAVTRVLDQIDVMKRVCAAYPDDFQFVTSAQGIEDAFAAGKIGSLFGLEGGQNIDSFPSVLRMLAELGIRYMTLTHNCNTPWADNWRTSSGDDTPEFDGLSSWGEKLIREMNRLGVFVDLSHVSKETMIDALKVSAAPVIFSHSAAFSVCGSYRNVQDDVLPLVKQNGGVIMVGFYTRYINCPPNEISDNVGEAELDQVVDHVQHLANVCGHDCVGIGSDFDGADTVPRGLEDVSKFPNLIAALIKRGWSEENIKKLIGGNLLRAMRQMEDIRDSMSEELPLEENMPREDGGERTNNCRTYYYTKG